MRALLGRSSSGCSWSCAFTTAIVAHLGRPAVPTAGPLLRELCAAAGLDLARADGALREQIETLRETALAVKAAVTRSQAFWRGMLDELPAGCRRPFSSSSRWQRRAHCKHQGSRVCLGEPPWQPRTANAAAAAPGPISAARGAAHGSVASALSSTISRERASGEVARQDVLAVRPHARCLADGRPCGGSGASSSSSREDFDNNAG